MYAIFESTYPSPSKKIYVKSRDGGAKKVDNVGEERDAGREKSEGESKRGCSASPVDRKYVTRALVSHGVFFLSTFPRAEERGVRTFSLLLSLVLSLSLLLSSSLHSSLRALSRGGLWCRVYGVGFMV